MSDDAVGVLFAVLMVSACIFLILLGWLIHKLEIWWKGHRHSD